MICKEQITSSEQHRAKCSVLSLRLPADARALLRQAGLLFLFFFLAQVIIAQNATVQYDINDSRNPDCPCHKLQKQAEEEYAKQKGEGNDLDNVEVNEGNRISSGVSVNSNIKHRKKMIRINKLKLIYSKNRRGIKRIRSDYSVCFKW